GPCDSVFIGFVSSNPFDNSNFHPDTWAMFDNVSFTNTGPAPAALPNPSFEVWTDVTVTDPDNWDSYNTLLASSGIATVSQTADAAVGTYAAQLETKYVALWGDTIPGILTNATIDAWGSLYAIPYTAEPANFSGQYKYAPSGSDMAEVQVLFFQAGSTIGGYYLPITSTAASYTSMGGPLGLTGTPDSMAVIIASGSNAGSVLKVDDLSLTGGNIGIQEMAKKLGIKVYPNPTYGVFSLEWEASSHENVNFLLTDVTGKTVMTKTLVSTVGTNVKELDIERLPAGIYTYSLLNSGLNKIGKLVKE
ncbi:MAG TPA: T9SS type A sorting domain-containing protein, partial [Flavobacteriales bacterium]|nr:T9SS type A sorting domain-containing protein [Flavobacteriales bacterium]